MRRSRVYNTLCQKWLLSEVAEEAGPTEETAEEDAVSEEVVGAAVAEAAVVSEAVAVVAEAQEDSSANFLRRIIFQSAYITRVNLIEYYTQDSTTELKAIVSSVPSLFFHTANE